MISLRKFFNRREEGRHNVRIMVNQRVGIAIGDIFKTDKALLKDLSLSGARFEIPNGNPIPGITHFHNLPFKMQIPGTRDIISATIDIVRIYTRDENDNSVYGFAVEFEEISKDDREKLEAFIRSKLPEVE